MTKSPESRVEELLGQMSLRRPSVDLDEKVISTVVRGPLAAGKLRDGIWLSVAAACLVFGAFIGHSFGSTTVAVSEEPENAVELSEFNKDALDVPGLAPQMALLCRNSLDPGSSDNRANRRCVSCHLETPDVADMIGSAGEAYRTSLPHILPKFYFSKIGFPRDEVHQQVCMKCHQNLNPLSPHTEWFPMDVPSDSGTDQDGVISHKPRTEG